MAMKNRITRLAEAIDDELPAEMNYMGKLLASALVAALIKTDLRLVDTDPAKTCPFPAEAAERIAKALEQINRGGIVVYKGE